MAGLESELEEVGERGGEVRRRRGRSHLADSGAGSAARRERGSARRSDLACQNWVWASGAPDRGLGLALGGTGRAARPG